MKGNYSKLFIIAGLIVLTGIYVSASAGAAGPAVNPPEAAAVKASEKPAEAAKPAEASAKPGGGAAQKDKQAAEPSLKLKPGAKGMVTVELQNDIPVRALQFFVAGVKMSEVRTTERTKGFLAKFNEKNGMVIVISTAGDEIAPGKGAVAEIICDKPASASLANGKIVWNKK